MAEQISRLSPSQERGLAAICAIGKDELYRVADALDKSELLISRLKIETLLVEQVGREHGPELARFLFGVAIGIREDSSAPETILDQITERLGSLPETDPRFNGWLDCKLALASLLALRSIRLAAKALEVSYDFERLYQAGRFLTTLRPVFDDSREEILGATVVQTLRLELITFTGDQSSLSISLDRADIEQLRRLCDEALRKADAVLAKVSAWNLPTIMPGQEEPKSGQKEP